MLRRLVPLVAFAAFAAFAALAACAPPKAQPAAMRPPVARAADKPAPFVVAIVVDQLAAWIAEERFPELPASGGFARLRREGTWLTTVRLPYAVTDTAPGHASLHTGVVPAESGIWGNEIPRAGGGSVTFLLDPTAKLVTPRGIEEKAGASGARLKVDTVADRLRAAHPDAVTIAISLKDRGAIMPGGKRPTVALWFDKGQGTFVTSTAFASTFPAWAQIADAEHVVHARSVPWTISDADWLARHVTVPDDAPGEGDLDGYGTTFPHVAKTSAAFRASPASDRMLFDLALHAIDAESRPGRPTLVLLSLSAHDIVSHVFGVDSWESWDQLYKLDAALGSFLEQLDRRGHRATVVLGADHGGSSMPETVRSRRPSECNEAADPYERPVCTTGSRIRATDIERELRAEMASTFGASEFFFGVADPYVFLTPAGRAAPPETRARIDAVVRRVLARRSNLELFDARTLSSSCPGVLSAARGVPERALPGEDTLTLICRSFSPNAGAGDYYMLPTHGSMFESDIVPGKGGSHGGRFLHDRTVPMLVRGAAAEGGKVVRAPVDFTVYARVLEAALGLSPENAPEIVQRLSAVR